MGGNLRTTYSVKVLKEDAEIQDQTEVLLQTIEREREQERDWKQEAQAGKLEIAELRDRVGRAEMERQEADAKRGAAEAEIGQLASRLENVEHVQTEALAEAEAQAASLETQNEALRQQLAELLAQPPADHAAQAAERIAALEQEAGAALEQAQLVERELKLASDSLQRAQQDRADLERALQASVQERDAAAVAANEEIKALLLRCEKAEAHNKVLDGGVAEAERHELTAQMDKLQQLLDASTVRAHDLEDAMDAQGAQLEEETYRRQQAESEAASARGRMRVLQDSLAQVPLARLEEECMWVLGELLEEWGLGGGSGDGAGARRGAAASLCFCRGALLPLASSILPLASSLPFLSRHFPALPSLPASLFQHKKN